MFVFLQILVSKMNLMIKRIQILLLLSLPILLKSQSFYFGPALGPAANFQRWEESDNDPLISINADVFVESVAEETKSAFFAMLGYRTRGSSTIFTNSFSGVNISSYKYKFGNAVLELGAKRYLNDNESRPYYMVGIRGEYTINTNLSEYDKFQTPFFPNDAFVNKLVYGFSFGGGFEKRINDFLNGFIQLSVSPDLNNQYYQAPLQNVPAPGGFGTISIPERRVKNTSVELKFGLKILRKVVYE